MCVSCSASCVEGQMAFLSPLVIGGRRPATAVTTRRRPAVALAPRPAARTRQMPRSGLLDPRTKRGRVSIGAPAPNRRVVSSELGINAPLSTVWAVLSDYSRLADYIPNLAMSKLKPHPRKGGIRLEQCGVQKILGFEFRASVVMDMVEVDAASDVSRAIDFGMVESRDFRVFEGTWKMESLPGAPDKTLLSYCVTIVPRGFVPVRAIEWRIVEDVPENMDAVKRECEVRHRAQLAAARRDAMRAQQQ